ncbi:hypothetical protein AC579_3646 [Pseudocercospora musae]|uniref:Uncharacterized protein n=1 Tax=Pseudocercospora musae TaxID=113226 RepID=A0A139ISS4_9PEZI|nr:hypothetical protein AC579_3646 [Pseudocercospora musae]
MPSCTAFAFMLAHSEFLPFMTHLHAREQYKPEDHTPHHTRRGLHYLGSSHVEKGVITGLNAIYVSDWIKDDLLLVLQALFQRLNGVQFDRSKLNQLSLFRPKLFGIIGYVLIFSNLSHQFENQGT